MLFRSGTGIFYKHLHYGDPTQLEEVIKAIKSWKNIEELDFPFVIYTQVFDPQDEPSRDPQVISGLNAIQSTDWTALVNFQG